MNKPLHLNEFPLSASERQKAEAALIDLIPEEQWTAYAPVLASARDKGLRFAVGGGIAFSLYAGMRRNTKDLDVFIHPPDQETFLPLMKQAGFSEYTAVPYDPTWSYRGVCLGNILDVLWRMLNNRGTIDAGWVRRGWPLQVRGIDLRLIPPEELIWSKLYILHRERCDWPDLLALLGVLGARLDWEYLLARVGEDAQLLGGVMSIFRWLCPGKAAALPPWIWARLGLSSAEGNGGPAVDWSRIALIKEGHWFPH